MDKKKTILAASVAGLLAVSAIAGAANVAFAHEDKAGANACGGKNACSGKNGCNGASCAAKAKDAANKVADAAEEAADEVKEEAK